MPQAVKEHTLLFKFTFTYISASTTGSFPRRLTACHTESNRGEVGFFAETWINRTTKRCHVNIEAVRVHVVCVGVTQHVIWWLGHTVLIRCLRTLEQPEKRWFAMKAGNVRKVALYMYKCMHVQSRLWQHKTCVSCPGVWMLRHRLWKATVRMDAISATSESPHSHLIKQSTCNGMLRHQPGQCRQE